MRTCSPSDGRATLLAAAAATGFVLTICGSNAVTPLLPRFAESYGFGSLATAVFFSMYFAALLSVLFLSARGPLVRRARIVLPAALLVSIASDGCQIAGDALPWLLFPGRFLTGAAVGLATGAATAMMVAIRGERGRLFLATGSMLGAGTGLAAAIAIVVFLPWPTVTVFAIHAAVTAICLIALIVGLDCAPNILVSEHHRTEDHRTGDMPVVCPGEGMRDVPGRPRERGAYLLGAMAWAVGALAVGSLSSSMLSQGVTDSLLVALLPAGVCLAASMVATLVGLGVTTMSSTISAVLFLVGGWLLVVLGLGIDDTAVVVLGAGIGGVGQAVGYRVGLARLTHGLDPIRQGRVASGYSAVAYAGAGSFVVLDGVLTSLLGPYRGPNVSALIFVLGCGLAVMTGRRSRNSSSLADMPSRTDQLAGQDVFPVPRDLLN